MAQDETSDTSAESQWYADRPWRVDFSRPDGAVLVTLMAAGRDRAAGLVQANLPQLSRDVVGEIVATLHGPEGEVIEGDEALMGASLGRVQTEDGRSFWVGPGEVWWE